MECYWTVNVILTDAEQRSIWLSLLFNNTPYLPKHKSTIVLLYNKCMLCFSCHFRPLKPLTFRMDHAKLLDVLMSLPVSHAILPRAVCFAMSRPANHAICSYTDSSGYATWAIRISLFLDYIIIYNYWLMRHWIWCDIDQRIPILTEAKPRSIFVFTGRYHIISNDSLVNNCFIIYHLEKDVQVSLHIEKHTELIHKFWDSQTFSRNSAEVDKTTPLLFYKCCALVSSFNIY